MKRIPIIVLATVSFFLTQCVQEQPEGHNNVSYEAYVNEFNKTLDSAVQTKERELKTYFQKIKSQASGVQKDKLLVNFFKLQLAFEKVDKKNITKSIEADNQRVENALKKHYIKHYNKFYDILMIDTSGNIFYTIKKEEDFRSNIFRKKLANTKLSKKLKNQTTESFVDFQFYDISQEPSAFFIEPVKTENSLIGWIVLQFSIRRINNIFSIDKNLGATSEVILVNKKHYMLTDSRFESKTTILKQQLAKENITSKFAQKKGHKKVIDYRGFHVISSFNVCSVLNHEWLIIAKINEAEVLTKYIKKYPCKLDSCLNKALAINQHQYTNIKAEKNYINVGIDEFKRSEKKTLYTHGISTCVGLLITLPNQTSYLAHISPYDKLYNETKTDVLGQMLARITYLEITQAQKHQLQFTLIAPHSSVAKKFINTLLNNGIFLNQIKIIFNKKARNADIQHKPRNNETTIIWHMKKNEQIKTEKTSNIETIDKKICI